MSFDAQAKAPGKILWIGGYSVIERPNISMVTTVDAYVHARVRSIEGNRIILSVPQMKLHIEGSIDSDTGKISIDSKKELLLLKTSVEIASRYISGKGVSLKGMEITTENDPEFYYTAAKNKVTKSGLGSSAAVTVASIAAILRAYGVDPSENDALHKLAQIAHSMATGKVGSGFDIAAATHGSIIYVRYSPEIINKLPKSYHNEDLQNLIKKEWDYNIIKFTLPSEFKLTFGNFLGEGMVTASALGSVSEFKKKNHSEYNELIQKINRENQKAIDALLAISKEGLSENKLDLFREAFNKGRFLTKQLGILSNVSIEDDDLTKLIEDSMMNGAFVAKLPGAGGRDSIAALSIHGREKELENFWKLKRGIQILKINITDKGALS